MSLLALETFIQSNSNIMGITVSSFVLSCNAMLEEGGYTTVLMIFDPLNDDELTGNPFERQLIYQAPNNTY